jgi:hypothetical protein
MKKPKLALNKPSEETLLVLFKDIESRKVAITLDRIASGDAVTTENGIYHYDTSNKWKIGVYVDCGWFDYIDYVQHGVKKITNGGLERFYPKVDKYVLKFRDKELSKSVWGIEAKIFAGID